MNRITLDISYEEATTLLELLRDDIPDKSFEAARTDAKDYRDYIVHQKNNLMHVQERLKEACGIH